MPVRRLRPAGAAQLTRRARSLGLLVVAAAMIASVAACTKSTPGGTITSTTTTTTTTTPAAGPTGPVSTGKITEKTASSCPFLAIAVAASNAGFRLDRITQLSQDGAVVGCRFYPLEHPTGQCPASCLAGERLPPGNVPGIDLLATTYASANAANNAFITLAEKGTNYQQEQIAPGNTGLCYQTTVWSADHGKDWACDFAKGSKVIVIRTVVTDPALNVVEIAKAVYPKF